MKNTMEYVPCLQFHSGYTCLSVLIQKRAAPRRRSLRLCWLMATLREPFQKSTVNLRSPIVVNPELRQAAQFVLEGNLPIRHPLLRERGERSPAGEIPPGPEPAGEQVLPPAAGRLKFL